MSVIFMLTILAVGVDLMTIDQEPEQSVSKRSSVCLGALGCFSTDAPFTSPQRVNSVVPDSPDKILTKFQLYSHEAPNTAQILDARHPETAPTVFSHYKKRPTQFIVHGFLNDPSKDVWLKNMKDELLKHGDYNVIIVDWSQGNKLPYGQATANTRVVGAQIALLIKELISAKHSVAGDFHIIGHSLGAHVAGYAGERVPGLGRITGLDPAGPYFENTDKVVRLDPSDAAFVDIIHSDAENLLKLGFGTKQPSGHSDFFPNLGHDQPGCDKSPVAHIAENGFWEGLKEVVGCNHMRAIRFFTESINTHCPFMAVPCASEADFSNNKCEACTAAGCAAMGFNAKNHIPPHGSHVQYFLTTSNRAPFCEYHLSLKVKFLAGKGTEERGHLKVVVHGSKGSTAELTANHDAMIFKPGNTYSFLLGTPGDIGAVQSVTFTWDHDSSLLNPSQWNILGLRHPTVFLDHVEVLHQEPNSRANFCAAGHGVETDTKYTMTTKC